MLGHNQKLYEYCSSPSGNPSKILEKRVHVCLEAQQHMPTLTPAPIPSSLANVRAAVLKILTATNRVARMMTTRTRTTILISAKKATMRLIDALPNRHPDLRTIDNQPTPRGAVQLMMGVMRIPTLAGNLDRTSAQHVLPVTLIQHSLAMFLTTSLNFSRLRLPAPLIPLDSRR